MMNEKYEVFRGKLASWETLFRKAGESATSIGRDRLISAHQ